MSTENNKSELDEFKSIIEEVKKDVEEAILLASQISDKYKVLSDNIKGMSGNMSKIFKSEKAGAIMLLAGSLINFAGKAYSEIKKESELEKMISNNYIK